MMVELVEAEATPAPVEYDDEDAPLPMEEKATVRHEAAEADPNAPLPLAEDGAEILDMDNNAAPWHLPERDELRDILSELEEMARIILSSNYQMDRISFDPMVVRGLEYYTGPFYEVELTFETKVPSIDGTLLQSRELFFDYKGAFGALPESYERLSAKKVELGAAVDELLRWHPPVLTFRLLMGS